jgi:hypothetical protein
VEEHRTRYKLRIRVLDTKQIGMKHSKRRRASKSSQPYQHGNVTHCGAGVFHQSVDGNSVCAEALGASHNKGAYLLPCPCPCSPATLPPCSTARDASQVSDEVYEIQPPRQKRGRSLLSLP